MNAKTFLRFLVGGLLLAGYYLAPSFLRDGEGVAPIHPDNIEELWLVVPGEDGFHLRRSSDSWELVGRREIRADPAQVGSFLEGLGNARLEAPEGAPEVDWDAAPELHVALRRGNDLTLQLGPRVRPFRSQLVRTNGRVHRISFDLSASLGLWQGDFAWDADRILDRIPLLNEGEEIVRIRLSNAFSDYLLERTDEIVERREDQFGEEEKHYRWTSGGTHSDRNPSTAAMYRYSQDLKMLVVDGVAADLTPDSEAARTVTFTTSGGDTFEVATGQPLPGETRRLLWLRQPSPSDAYLVDDRFFHRFTPAGARLYESRPVFVTEASRGARITYERDGHLLVLERNQRGEWEITRPRIPYSIHTPEPEPGTPPESMAEMYASGLDSIGTEELFVPDTEDRELLVDGVFDEPAARLLVEDSDGDRLELLVSAPVAGTGRVFVSMNGKIGVLDERFIGRLAPDIKYFLNPREVEGRTIEW